MPKRRPKGRPANRRRPNVGSRSSPGYFGEFGQDMGRVSENALRSLLKTLNVESKYSDVTVSLTPNNNYGFTLLNGIPQGDSATDRDGHSVKITSIDIQLYATIHASASTTFVRVALVLDRMPDQAAPGATDVFNVNNVNSFPNVDNSPRFEIIWDKQLGLNSLWKTFHFPGLSYSSDLELHTHYNGSGSGVTAITQNSLWLVTFSSEATNTPTVGGYTRIRYVDN